MTSVRTARLALCGLVAIMLSLFTHASLASAASPSWSVRSIAVPTNFVPGDTGNDYFYENIFANKGGAVTDSSKPFVVTDTLPTGLTVRSVALLIRSSSKGVGNSGESGTTDFAPTACVTEMINELATVKCTVTSSMSSVAGDAFEPTSFYPSEAFRMVVHVNVSLDAKGLLQNTTEISGGGADPVSLVSDNPASSQPADPGVAEFSADLTDADGEALTQAGGHPFALTTAFAVNTEHAPAGNAFKIVPAGGDLRNIEVRLPPGLVGNPQAAPACAQQQFGEVHAVHGPAGNTIFQNSCPGASVVGLLVIDQLEGRNVLQQYPIYDLVPPEGMPAQFGIQVAGAPIYIDTKVRTGGDYGITAYLVNTTQARPIGAASVTFWGVPADPVHDRVRGTCLNAEGFFSLGACPAETAGMRPFLRMPTACGAPLLSEMLFDTWVSPAVAGASSPLGSIAGCGALSFTPTVVAEPTTTSADSPSGLVFKLHLPQTEAPDQLAVPDLRDVTVTLPEGVTVNPASAGGLGACAPQEIELDTELPANCPSASKIGSVEVKTPLLDHPIAGGVFLATQERNPFGSLLAIYIAAHDPRSGVVLKLAGRVELDSKTGRLTTRFTNNPQLPFEDLDVELFNGPRAPLRSPPRCGSEYRVQTSMTPYSAPDSGPAAEPSDSFAIETGPGGGSCPNGALSPKVTAGLANAMAGSYSPFSLRLYREDGTDEFTGLTTQAPTGLVARLAGIPYCPESAVAQVLARSHPGEGGLESNAPSCPSASAVGSAAAAAGAGSLPYFAKGTVYLAGPYKGAPLSLLTVVPAVAGPFDLGVVAVRIALRIDEATAQVTAESDPLPTILSGIPLDVRDIRVDLDRPNFTVAPTSCEPKVVHASVFGVGGQATTVDSRFQVNGCKKLGFKPELKLSLAGATKRAGHPALKAVLTYPKKGAYANIARAQVGLPHAEFLDQGNLDKVCTQPQLRSATCPKKSIYGHAKAWTPLLDKPLEGPVYLGVGFGYKLPALVADLNGQIRILLKGKVDTTKDGGIRNTFEAVPDAPVSRFVLELKGGKKYGLLVNSENICRKQQRANARFVAQNGRSVQSRPAIENDCGPRKLRSQHRSHGHPRSHSRGAKTRKSA